MLLLYTFHDTVFALKTDVVLIMTAQLNQRHVCNADIAVLAYTRMTPLILFTLIFSVTWNKEIFIPSKILQGGRVV
jgi:hypothetical protein